MKLIKLANQLEFNTETQYFDYCIDSYHNGNFNQCKELFNAMTKADKKRLIQYIKGCYDYTHPVETFYFNLI